MDLYVLYAEHDLIDILYTFLSVSLIAVYLTRAWKQYFVVKQFLLFLAVSDQINRAVRESYLIGFWLQAWLLKVRNKVSSESPCSISV